GQNIRTSLSQVVADELRVPLSSVTLLMGDTDKTPFDMGTFGSRTIPTMAPQMARAASVAREMLIDQAAERWQLGRQVLTARDGDFLGVVAPTERVAARAASALKATWLAPEGQPSSETLFDYLKEHPDGHDAAPAVATPMPPAVTRTFEATYRIPYIAHVPL